MRARRFSKLGGPIVLTLTLCALSAGMLWYANKVLQQSRSTREAASQAAKTAGNRYRQTAQDEALIRQTIQRFDILRNRGVIGAERRLDWADRVRASREDLHLPQLDFEIAPLRNAGAISSPGDYQLGVSRMQLHALLLHEGDLFDLLNTLHQPVSAIVAPRRCTLTPINEQIGRQTANLKVDCVLDWMTAYADKEVRP